MTGRAVLDRPREWWRREGVEVARSAAQTLERWASPLLAGGAVGVVTLSTREPLAGALVGVAISTGLRYGASALERFLARQVAGPPAGTDDPRVRRLSARVTQLEDLLARVRETAAAGAPGRGGGRPGGPARRRRRRPSASGTRRALAPPGRTARRDPVADRRTLLTHGDR